MSEFEVGQRVRAVASRPSGNGDIAEFTVEQVGPNFLATNYLQFINSFWTFELIEPETNKTYNVGDRVSYKGDKGIIIFDDPKYHHRFTVYYDEGGFQGHTEDELEAV